VKLIKILGEGRLFGVISYPIEIFVVGVQLVAGVSQIVAGVQLVEASSSSRFWTRKAELKSNV
jgi:hypothetical protein